MKIKYYISVLAFATICFSGCLDLNYTEVTTNDEKWIYESPIYGVEKLVNDLYAIIQNPFKYDHYNGALKASATDEADYALSMSDVHKFYNGAWSPINPLGGTWSNAYAGIAEANIFLEKIDKINLDDYLHNASGETSYKLLKAKFELFPYEARFLRAYFYFELVKTYGDVPLVTKSLTNAEANSLYRTPANEIFQFIIDECDAIAEFLPISYSTELSLQIGRASRPMALALKARTQLYAASPLFNTTNDPELWRQAALSNKLVIDKCAQWGIKLDKYSSLWGNDNFFNSEMIMIAGAGSKNEFERYNFPIGIENASSGNCPTQSLVDMYEYKSTGKTFGETWGNTINLYVDNPYDGLDPRFAMTVAKHGDVWPNNSPALEITEGGKNASPLYGATPTGYYLKKYCDGSVDISSTSANTKRHSWIIFRLGEFYLNFAEAAYNYLGDADATGEFGMSANQAINVIRSRSDVNMPLFSGNDNFVEKYIRERMIELAFEDHRFWDVRRWKKGDDFFKQIKTISLNTNTAGDVIITRGTKSRQWNDKYYLFPIPFSEKQKNPNLTQNPGWDN